MFWSSGGEVLGEIDVLVEESNVLGMEIPADEEGEYEMVVGGGENCCEVS